MNENEKDIMTDCDRCQALESEVEALKEQVAYLKARYIHWDTEAEKVRKTARNAELADNARNRGKPWTVADLEVAEDLHLTIAGAARQLGRTYESVREVRRQARGLPPKPGSGRPRPTDEH